MAVASLTERAVDGDALRVGVPHATRRVQAEDLQDRPSPMTPAYSACSRDRSPWATRRGDRLGAWRLEKALGGLRCSGRSLASGGAPRQGRSCTRSLPPAGGDFLHASSSLGRRSSHAPGECARLHWAETSDTTVAGPSHCGQGGLGEEGRMSAPQVSSRLRRPRSSAATRARLSAARASSLSQSFLLQGSTLRRQIRPPEA